MGSIWGCFWVLWVHGCNRWPPNTQTRCVKVEKIPNANIWVGLHIRTLMVERECGHRKTVVLGVSGLFLGLFWGALGSWVYRMAPQDRE